MLGAPLMEDWTSLPVKVAHKLRPSVKFTKAMLALWEATLRVDTQFISAPVLDCGICFLSTPTVFVPFANVDIQGMVVGKILGTERTRLGIRD